MIFSLTALVLLAAPSMARHVTHHVTHHVTVGFNGTLTYFPSTVYAEVHDKIQFNFMPKNHTATQSSFESPCTQLHARHAFNSGFKPVSANSTEHVSATLRVRDKKPIWIYCQQVGHCGQGMVFAVNPPAKGNTFEKFRAAALAIGAASSTTAASTATSSASAPTSTASSYPVTHNVTVGFGGQLVFNPSNITAKPHDIIAFQFNGTVHTATQSNFLQPCRPFGETSPSGAIGFDSGFAVTAPTTFNVVVNDTKPIWVYCRQVGHCGKGMVFSANAEESGPHSFAAFKALAISTNGTASTTTSSSSAAPTGYY